MKRRKQPRQSRCREETKCVPGTEEVEGNNLPPTVPTVHISRSAIFSDVDA